MALVALAQGNAGVNVFTQHVTAMPDDIDELGHVNNAVWVRWIQEIAVAHWMAHAFPEHRDAYFWVVTRHEVDYHGNVGVGETVKGETWVAAAPKGARFDRAVRFTGADGKLKVEAVTTWAMLERATGRPARVRAEIVAPFL